MRTFSRFDRAIFRQTLPTRPRKRSMPRKFRSGFCSAMAARNVPSPHPRSTSTGASCPKISRKFSCSTIESRTNSIAALFWCRCARPRILNKVTKRTFLQMCCLTGMRKLALLFATLIVAHPVLADPTPRTAIFAGGCFWCIQPAFDKAPGVLKTVVGYSGGTEPNPTYELVTAERTKYRESIEITYDPAKISFDQLLDIYWRQINPTQSDGQFTDIGPSYRAAIFYQNDDEKKIAEASKAKLAASGRFDKPIVTEILPAMKFWPAEDYHQKYYQQNPEHFQAFEKGSGRVS